MINFKMYFLTNLILSFFVFTSCTFNQQLIQNQITSPDKRLVANFEISQQKQAFYTVSINGEEVIQDSQLGIISEDQDFSSGLILLSVLQTESVYDEYNMLHGKKKLIIYDVNKIYSSFEFHGNFHFFRKACSQVVLGNA